MAENATRSPWIGIGAALLTAVSPILTPVYSWAMAEPLTMLLGFSGLWLMVRQVQKPGKTWPLIISAVLTGLAFLTRYSAAAFVAAAGLGWLLLTDVHWRKRFIKGLIFGVVALLPMLVWVLIQFSYTSGVASRTIEDSAAVTERLVSFWPQFGDVLLSWLVPVSWIHAPAYPRILNAVLTWGIAILLTGMGVFFFRCAKAKETTNPMRKTWPALVSIFIPVYTGMIFITYLTTYPPITLDNRMFSPFHTCVLILLPIFLERLFASRRNSILRFAPLALLLAFAMWYGWRDVRIVQQNYREGLGFNSVAWRSSELVEWVKKTPEDTRIITNETMAVLYLTGRNAFPLAEIYADLPQDLDAAYGSNPDPDDKGQQVFNEGGNPLVLFNSIDSQFQSIYADQSARRVEGLVKGLDVVFEGEDGVIYLSPK